MTALRAARARGAALVGCGGAAAGVDGVRTAGGRRLLRTLTGCATRCSAHAAAVPARPRYRCRPAAPLRQRRAAAAPRARRGAGSRAASASSGGQTRGRSLRAAAARRRRAAGRRSRPLLPVRRRRATRPTRVQLQLRRAGDRAVVAQAAHERVGEVHVDAAWESEALSTASMMCFGWFLGCRSPRGRCQRPPAPRPASAAERRGRAHAKLQNGRSATAAACEEWSAARAWRKLAAVESGTTRSATSATGSALQLRELQYGPATHAVSHPPSCAQSRGSSRVCVASVTPTVVVL